MRCVILEHVSERRSDPDRILVVQLGGTARRHSRWHALTAEEEAAAVAELREVAGGRADLLAEVAGVEVGFAEEWDEPRAVQAADLCRRAAADEKLIPRWIEAGSAAPTRTCPRFPAVCTAAAAVSGQAAFRLVERNPAAGRRAWLTLQAAEGCRLPAGSARCAATACGPDTIAGEHLVRSHLAGQGQI
jgi:hypothetical protein